MRALRLAASRSGPSRSGPSRVGPSHLVLDEDLPIPKISDGEALIRVSLAGVCSTDLELVKGYMGFEGVLGHEFVGVVEKSADPSWLNRRVVSSINFADNSSPEFSKFGREHHPHRQVLGILGHDGAMADYVSVPLANLFAVPDSVTDRAAVFTEPLAAAVRISQQLVVDPATRIAVLGPGRLGMLIGRVLSLGGADVMMLGRSPRSLNLAQKWRLPSGIAAAQTSSSFDMVVDATGEAEGLATAVRLTRPLGTVVLKSTFEGAQPVNLTKVVVDEIKVVGSRCGPFGPALRLLESGAVGVTDLIDAEYPAAEAVQAMEHASRPGMRKVLINFGV